MSDKDGRANFVGAPAQSLKNLPGMLQVARLADNFAIERNERVGGKND